MADLTLKNVKKEYLNGITAVRNFSLEIKNGEFIVLVGPSGCGKTTILRMIAGLEKITAGEISIDGTIINDIPARNRNIAMVFQNYAIYPHLTVYKNIAFPLEIRKFDRAEIDKKVRDAANTLDISELLGRMPKTLSGGQQQRIALGRAMVVNPSVFLFDEPLSNLDAKLRASMREEIVRLHKKLEATFVYVTHDQTEALTMGERIVVMSEGQIQQVGTPYNICNSPENEFVKDFIAAPQTNIIEELLKNGI